MTDTPPRASSTQIFGSGPAEAGALPEPPQTPPLPETASTTQQLAPGVGTPAATPRSRIGVYSVERVLGEGGMGTVYECHDPDLDRRVAVKVLKNALAADPEMKTRFIREARATFVACALERSGTCLSASLLTCHPWNAHPELGWSVVVVTDNDQAGAEKLADELAERAWGTRHALPPKFDTPMEAISKARRARVRRKLGCVVLADASDVVSAGAPGESTGLLGELIANAQGLTCYVPIRDPAVVESLWSRSEGETVHVALGGKLDPARGAPLDVTAVLEKKTRSHGVDRTLVLTVGTVKIVVVEGPALAIRPAFFSNAGLSLWNADVIVVKNFFPFRMFFLPIARLTIYVKTSGVTDFDAAFVLPFAGAVHPREHVPDWRDADKRRRAA